MRTCMAGMPSIDSFKSANGYNGKDGSGFKFQSDRTCMHMLPWVSSLAQTSSVPMMFKRFEILDAVQAAKECRLCRLRYAIDLWKVWFR